MQKLEEAKREARRRGEQKTQTSDAKFDEKFQVGHGLSGEANKPWYAKSGSMLQSEEAAPLQVYHKLMAQHRWLAHTKSEDCCGLHSCVSHRLSSSLCVLLNRLANMMSVSVSCVAACLKESLAL